MAITVDWPTRVINVPKADMTMLSATLYELDVNTFRLTLKDLEDDEAGMPFVRTHNHNTQVTLGGVTLARTVEIINDYTITFEDGAYAVTLTGANNNIADVMNLNNVSLRSNNSAGLVVVDQSTSIVADLMAETVEVGLTFKNALRLMAAALAGKLSGAPSTTLVFRNAIADSKDRITATVDSDGNRTSITTDLS